MYDQTIFINSSTSKMTYTVSRGVLKLYSLIYTPLIYTLTS